MNNDKFQDKYNEIFQEMKDDKMNWDFEDFLKKAENQDTPIIPIATAKKPIIPRNFWMAASIVLLFGIFFGIKNWSTNSDVETQNSLVQNQVQNQRDEILQGNDVAYQDPQDSLKTNPNTMLVDSLQNEVSNPEKVMNLIVPKKGRLQKIRKQKLAYQPQNNQQNNAPEYEDNFVIVNGHKITSEEEAINVAKYSFQMLSNNVAKTIATSVVQENPDEN